MKTLQARYVFPVAGEPIRDGAITLDGEQIAAVGRKCGGPVHDLGNVAIVPGLVNGHAHLDFSELAKPLGRPGIDFVDWIRLVMEFRRQAAGREGRAVELGLRESVRCGTTTLGDVAQPNWPIETVAAAPLAVTVFQELIGPTTERIAPALTLAKNHCRLAAAQSHWQAGLSPHAPYSVHPELLAALVALSKEQRVPIAMHLAESAEELQLLRSGDGPLRALLQELGAWGPTAPHLNRRVLDDLHGLAAAHRALVVHGGCLDDHELHLLAENAERMTVVYCPRTHEWFRREPYPLEKMLAAGVTVALGTDGRGSSPDLSVLGEMRCVAERHPSIALPRVLRMGTIDGARALGQEREAGSLEPGKRADLAIIALPNRDAADPHELLFDSEARVMRCDCRGREVYRSSSVAGAR